ncbi:HEAT repeat domain-containing protein [Streptomyces sp. NBC_01104]|uniref:HEAT repeat domain-containing protein n=1 Tax=Streptomyces sp. NBC_01104 TaxID=2903750 RepID=UPI00386E5786|nr:HEAT repeat domain-containing protein [Streptomyces sp. NBC_01104]
MDRLQGLAETLHEHGRVTNEVRTVGPVPAPAPVARRLGVDEHTDVLYIERRRLLNGLPLSLDLTYVPMDLGAGLIGADLENTDVFRLLESLTGQLRAAHELVYRPLRNPDGPPQPQVEYKLRRFVNDYVAPPKSGARLGIALESFERMRTDLAEMGAKTPHELMRCAEVSFIRDCAEMAARSSLARTESRWGLYHERTDHPERDDTDWFHHLDLYKSASGAMEFTARPVAPYLVPVEGFAPAGGPVRRIGEVEPEGVGTAGARDAAPVSGSARRASPAAGGVAPSTSPRILELLALAEGEPELAALAPYLADPDPAVRRAAVATLTESTPPGAGPALAGALADPAVAVRAAVAASLRELVEVLEPSPALRTPLVTALASADPVVRAAALDTLRALRLGAAELYAGTLDDPDLDVRVETVRALVSVDAVEGLVRAAADPAREVRVAVAKGLAAVRSPAPAPLDPLLDDPDALVRAAALAALAGTGCPPSYAERAVAALTDPAWRVRAGAATALSSADPDRAVTPLAEALDDRNADVRKAAVLALLRHPGDSAARKALAGAVSDADADVRAYAGRGVGVNGA